MSSANGSSGFHVALRALQKDSAHITRIESIAASIASLGIETVTAALEAVVAAVVDILTRLIGEEMMLRLIDLHAPDT